MAEANAISPAGKKRRGWRIFGLIIAVLIVLIVAAFFIVTSTGFFKSVILPRVGKSLNSDITVSDASIHIFSAVTLRDLKVTPNGAETLLTAPEVRARYSLWQIIRGNIKIGEVAMVSPTIHIIEKPDGSSNLDPLMKALTKEPKEKKKPEKPSKPAQVQLDHLTITNATVIQEKLYAGANRDLLEISNANFTVSNLKNGGSGKIAMSAGILVQKNPPAPETNGVLQAKLNGNYDFAMSADLKPQSIQGQSQLTVTRAEGSLSDLAACVVKLNCDVAPTEIKQVALQFQKNGEVLGEIHAN
ncbi:MAG TPA: AsmA family protein, partial [Verrucomicrobiae bacterium]|nr:AsmA family protein [Verrucomicrobiae bacterium]